MPKILIVEDEANIRKFMSVNLAARGYEVIEAEDAHEGLTRLRDESPAALLLDIRLPDMSGWELLEIMAADPVYPQIPVIVITASIGNNNLEHLNYKNLRKVLIKPVSIQELTREVQDVLD